MVAKSKFTNPNPCRLRLVSKPQSDSRRSSSRRQFAVPRHIDPRVAAVFDNYPPKVRAKLLRLRKLILDTAAITDGVGPITETLKWGEPAYLTEVTKSGSTIRLGWKPKSPNQLSIYFNCNTTLVDTFRSLFPELEYEGNRAIVFAATDKLPQDDLCECFAAALTYHKRKTSQAKSR